jgi:hypothetical protein|nr:Conserved hypothetical protein [Methylocystis sp. SC2]
MRHEHEHSIQISGSDSRRRGLLASREKWVLIGFLAIAGFYLVTEHTAHLFGALPYLLLLACPLMHIFMHHGHGRHESSEGANKGPSDGQSELPSQH